jgi:hypothetical protein
MEPVVLALIGAATGIGGFVAAWVSSASRERDWRRAAQTACLTNVRVEKTAGFVSSLSGEAGPLAVRIERYARGKYERGSRIVVRGLQHQAGELSFRREGLGSALGKALGSREIVLGDPWFDLAVYLQGSAELACALFDDETRLRLVHMLEGTYESMNRLKAGTGDGSRASLADGELNIELPGRFGSDAERCVIVLPSVLVTAARLVRPADLGARLAVNLGKEPVEAVRLAVLQALLERHPGHPTSRAALAKAARRDGSEEVRLRAALALGDEGRDVLLEIAASETSHDQRAARAIEALGDHLDGGQALAILDRTLLDRRLESARACLQRLGRAGGAEVLARLKRVLLVEDGAVAAAAARAAGATGEAAAEPLLIEALGRHSGEALLAVVDELDRMGTAAAVMPLRAAQERSGDGDCRRAARQAIAAIQSRLQGAAPGQLSLAGGEAGQVSLADDGGTRGRLSLDDADRERDQ